MTSQLELLKAVMWLLPFRFINWMYTIYFCQAYIVKPITVLYRIVRIHTMYSGIWWFGADSFSSLARLLSLIFLQDLGSDNTRFQYLNSFYWYCALSHSLLAVSFNIKIDHHDWTFSQQNNAFQGIVLRPQSRKHLLGIGFYNNHKYYPC